MRTVAVLLACAAFGSSFGARLTVLDGDQRPVAAAAVVCLDPAEAVARRTGPDGTLDVPSTCRAVRCEQNGMLPGNATVAGDTAVCRVEAPLLLEIEVPGCASGCVARITAGPIGHDRREVPVMVAEGSGVPRAVLPPLRPQSLSIEVAGAELGWRCSLFPGFLGSGRRVVKVAWRAPVEIRGTVTDASRRPQPGVVVRAWSGRPWHPRSWEAGRSAAGRVTCGPERDLAETTSDAAGNFRIAADPGQEALVIAGTIDDPSRLAAVVVHEPPGDPLALELEPFPHVRAKLVYRESGKPAAACRAELRPEDPDADWIGLALRRPLSAIRCEKDGTLESGPFRPAPFELELTPDPGLFELHRGPKPKAVSVIDLGTLRVSRGESYDVLVVGPDQAPIASAKVGARATAGIILNVEARTGADGIAHLDGLPERASLLLTVKADGHPVKYLSAPGRTPGAPPYRVVLEPGGTILGRVVSTDGRVLPSVKVTMGTAARPVLAIAIPGPDEGGYFSISTPTGEIRVGATANGFKDAQPVTVHVEPGAVVRDVVLTLVPRAALAGRVVDVAGHPVSGARVRLVNRWDLEDVDEMPAFAETETDDDGRFALAGSGNEYGALLATKSGFGPAVASSLPSKDGEPVTITLAEPARVIAQLPQQLPPRVRVVAVDGAGVGHAVEAGATQVTIDDLAPGDGSAELNPGPSKKIRLVAGQTTEVSLTTGGVIEGTVTTAADGAPVPRAHVSLGIRATLDLAGYAGFTDASGHYRFEGVPAGSYVVAVESPVGRADQSVTLVEDGALTVDFPLHTVALHARVTNEKTNQPIGSTVLDLVRESDRAVGVRTRGVEIFPPGEPGYRRAIFNCTSCDRQWTDDFGTATLSVDQPGRFVVQASADGYKAAEREIDLREGDNAVELALAPKPARQVNVTLQTDPPGQHGELLALAGDHQEAWTYAGGIAPLEDVAAGRLDVYFRVIGFGAGHAVVDVPDTGAVDVTVTAVRGGELVIPVESLDVALPVVYDANGVEWAGPLSRIDPSHSSEAARRETLPGLGPAWLLSDLPPGNYSITVGGASRPPVEVVAGARAVTDK